MYMASGLWRAGARALLAPGSIVIHLLSVSVLEQCSSYNHVVRYGVFPGRVGSR